MGCEWVVLRIFFFHLLIFKLRKLGLDCTDYVSVGRWREVDGNEDLIIFQSQKHQDHLFSDTWNSSHNFHIDTRGDSLVFGVFMIHQLLKLDIQTCCAPLPPPVRNSHLVLVSALLTFLYPRRFLVTEFSLLTFPSRQQVVQGSEFLVTEGALDAFPDDAVEDQLVM